MDYKNPAGDHGPIHLVDEAHNPDTRHPRKRCKTMRRIFAVLVLSWIGFNFVRDVFQLIPFVTHLYESAVTRIRVPPGVNIDFCPAWKEGKYRGGWRYPYETTSEFELPLSSDTLLFLARGIASGSVDVIQEGEGDKVKVEVLARYKSLQALQGSQACLINRGEGQNGVGIFGPDWSPPSSLHSAFVMTVSLPHASKGLLNIKNFETDMPLFTQNIGNLAEGVHFDSISLKTSNLPIKVESLSATKAQSQTENNHISGIFNVTSSLFLLTANAPIDVLVNANAAGDAQEPTDVKMQTANAPIKSKYNLRSATGTHGAFRISALTSNSPMDAIFLSAPVNSELSLNALTSLGPVRVNLHETYQGTFQLRTSLSRPVVTWNGDAKDPSGQGRRRNVDVRSAGSSVDGSVTWGEDGADLGHVDVETSWSPVTLKF